jgi:hypothetical protein
MRNPVPSTTIPFEFIELTSSFENTKAGYWLEGGLYGLWNCKRLWMAAVDIGRYGFLDCTFTSNLGHIIEVK